MERIFEFPHLKPTKKKQELLLTSVEVAEEKLKHCGGLFARIDFLSLILVEEMFEKSVVIKIKDLVHFKVLNC